MYYFITDLETARRLELVTSENSIMDQNKYTLFGLMNNTVTVSGHRRLRMEILQPYSSRHIIEKRLDKVQYLVENEDKLGSLQVDNPALFFYLFLFNIFTE